MKIVLSILLFHFSLNAIASAEENKFFNKISLGAEMGTWRPNNLVKSATPITLSFKDEHFYFGFFLLTPIRSNLFARLSTGYYRYSDDQNRSITLVPILLDIKYLLISGSPISPFVSYGFGTCIGRDDDAMLSSLDAGKNELGFSINFGTGFDLLLFKNLSAGIEFRYHYLKFSRVFIFTNDYSGPKINLSLFYLF